MRIAEHKIDEIIQATDIVMLVGEYVSLKQRGRNYLGLCPFHTEKTPSFTVSPDKNIWHCFGCGSGGNAAHFLMKIQNMSFPEALKALAQRCGVRLETEEKDDNREKYFKILGEAAAFYHAVLLDNTRGKAALQYLYKRKLSLEIIKKHKLGFANDAPDALCAHLRKKGFSLDDAASVGLAKKKDNGAFADYFRNRVMIPISNYKGDVIAFGGRVLADIQPKFLNSPESPVFSKRKNLYLLQAAKAELGKKKYAIVVEGYFDALVAHQFGFTNTVASLGTSLTREQAYLLLRYSKNVVLALDPDEAGEKAADRAIEIFEDTGLNVKVMILPVGVDPDLFLRENGPQEFKKKLAKSVNIIDFRAGLAAKKYKLDTPEGKIEFIRELMPSIVKIKEHLKRDEYIKKFADSLKVREEIVRSYCVEGGKHSSSSESLRLFEVPELEEKLLKAVFYNPAHMKKIKQELENNFDDLKFGPLFTAIAGKENFADGKELLEYINNSVRDEAMVSEAAKISFQEAAEPLSEEFVDGIVKRIKDARLKTHLQNLEREVSSLIDKGELISSSDKFIEYQKLVRYFRGGKQQENKE